VGVGVACPAAGAAPAAARIRKRMILKVPCKVLPPSVRSDSPCPA
jgi:hypothetical protein